MKKYENKNRERRIRGKQIMKRRNKEHFTLTYLINNKLSIFMKIYLTHTIKNCILIL